MKSKTEDVENNSSQLNELKTQLGNLVNECETMYGVYAEKRDEVLQLKAATGGNSGWGAPVSNWGSSAADSWGSPAVAVADSWGATSAAEPAGNLRLTFLFHYRQFKAAVRKVISRIRILIVKSCEVENLHFQCFKYLIHYFLENRKLEKLYRKWFCVLRRLKK